MIPLSQEQILDAFAPSDRKFVVLPDLQEFDWPALDYCGWRDTRSGSNRGFLVSYFNQRAVGLVLRFGVDHSERRTGMCGLCLSVHHDGQVAMAMIDSWFKPRTSYGIHICKHLDCSLTVRGLKSAGGMGETISNGQKIERFQEKLNRFVGKLAENS